MCIASKRQFRIARPGSPSGWTPKSRSVEVRCWWSVSSRRFRGDWGCRGWSGSARLTPSYRVCGHCSCQPSWRPCPLASSGTFWTCCWPGSCRSSGTSCPCWTSGVVTTRCPCQSAAAACSGAGRHVLDLKVASFGRLCLNSIIGFLTQPNINKRAQSLLTQKDTNKPGLAWENHWSIIGF